MKDLRKHFITTFVIGAALLTGIVLLVNMVFDNINIGRFDLTADQIYRLSPAVGKILSELEAPIDITYYVSSSEKMPTQWKNLERDVIDKLEDLRIASKGKLTYTVFDPSAEEEKEAYEEQRHQEENGDAQFKESAPHVTRKRIAERLSEKGVIPFGVQSTDRDEMSIKRVYSSIVISYLDRKDDVIEEVRPDNFGSLEYEIISRIYKLIRNRKPQIGFYPAPPDQTQPMNRYYNQPPPQDNFEAAVELLQQAGYDVTRTGIQKDDPVPDDIQTMVIMAESPLSDRQLFEIDKLVHKGVRVVMCGQMNMYQITPSRTPGEFDLRNRGTGMNLNQLTENYGFGFDKDMFMDRNTSYIRIPVYQTRNMGMFQVRQQRFEPVTKPVLITIKNVNINNKVSISNKIDDLFYLYGGRLTLEKDTLAAHNISYRTLFTSSDFAWTQPSAGYGNVIIREPHPDDALKHAPLGMLFEGRFPAGYAGQEVPEWPRQYNTSGDDSESDTTASAVPITGESQDNKLIVMGSAWMFHNEVLQSLNSHRALLMNCVDALTLGDDLINIRSKNISVRTIRATSGFEKAASKFFVIWFPPMVFVALGILLTFKRKKK